MVRRAFGKMWDAGVAYGLGIPVMVTLPLFCDVFRLFAGFGCCSISFIHR